MNRRTFLWSAGMMAGSMGSAAQLWAAEEASDRRGWAKAFRESAKGQEWRVLWEKEVLGEARGRACDKEMGEELGWLVSPVLNGFYYGYLATREARWAALLVDWADACLRRAVKEPDGYPGWPKGDGGGGDSTVYAADSLLGEAMMLRPVVLMAARILETPELKTKFGQQAQRHLDFAERIFAKWESRDCWREVKDGGVWVVAAFGVDRQTGEWSAGYVDRQTTGFSNPDNKQNHIARWMLAMYEVTKKAVYRDRAEKWFRVMKSRLRTRVEGKFAVWNYWEPAGPWDYQANGAPKHWVGVHPNGGYYAIDVEGMVAAYEHGLVFSKADIDRLVATNRDFMWDRKMEGAKFQRIDGEPADPRWKGSPGVLWESLVPYDETLRKVFIANHEPGGWGGLAGTPWFLAGGDAGAA